MEDNSIEENRVDPSELDSTFQLIRKVENRRFLFDSKDPKHSKRELLSSAWEDVASDIRLNGNQVTGMFFYGFNSQ